MVQNKFPLINVVVDSREQRPYQFNDYPTITKTLPIGDYSIFGLENYIAVERKEINDLISCLSHDRERFERELYRSKCLEYFGLIIECSLSDLVNGKYRSEMNPNSVIQSLLTFSIRYRLPVFFAESRTYGQIITESLLLKYARECEQKINKLKKEKKMSEKWRVLLTEAIEFDPDTGEKMTYGQIVRKLGKAIWESDELMIFVLNFLVKRNAIYSGLTEN